MQMPMQQPVQPAYIQGPSMMPNTAGNGKVPMALTTDPKIKCQVDENCQYVGNSICSWPNCAWLPGPEGGCGKRYCYNCMYEKSQ